MPLPSTTWYTEWWHAQLRQGQWVHQRKVALGLLGTVAGALGIAGSRKVEVEGHEEQRRPWVSCVYVSFFVLEAERSQSF